MEEAIRECYSKTLKFSSQNLVEMMVLDDLFIIEMFCKLEELSLMSKDNPIFNLSRVITELIPDLLPLENQISFMVLQ
ncbi:hypothetical protein RchiOBHm_Chr7g0226261 [Rosa chinensis]|uniref:Uncharacterized protein n=1 Tax=Rosa chinensis TaxID=74649 RepID=A0A2P6PEB5_ROSCH|nr:hypothetical protein RchiOBHm_Chr7g0226261 [Rosa chinensis]